MTRTETTSGFALLSGRARRWAAALVAVAAVATAALATVLHDSGSTRFDRWTLTHADRWIGDSVASGLLRLSEPALSFGVVAVITVVVGVRRRWRAVLLCLIAPGLTVVLTEYVLKPLVGRYLSITWLSASASASTFGKAFPSGHESGVAGAAVLAVVAAAHLTVDRRIRVVVAAVAAVWALLAAIGLVRNSYHYALDTVGSMTLALAVVLGTALVIDAVADR